jgi:hypothetical protein
MARYELGAVYKINTDSEIVYYVRLLALDCYGVFAPLGGNLCEETLSKTPYRLHFVCNTFPVKRGIWEKVLPSPDSKDVERWQRPKFLANYANHSPVFSLERCQVFHKGNPYKCKKELFVNLVKSGMIELIFNRHENIPSFLKRYYEGWPESYIFDKVRLHAGTPEYQKQKLEAFREMGFEL